MNFTEVIKQRQSLRKFDPNREIPDDVLLRILEAGQIAPSASNMQPWRFLVIKSPVMRQKVCQCYEREWLKNAPVILAIVGDKNKAWIRKEDNHNSIEVDLTIALDHIILSATNEGVGSCWILAYNPKKLHEVLNLKENEYISCITPLGYPPADYEKKVKPERKKLSEIVVFI